MKHITLGKLFELYVDIFDKFGLYLIKENDQMIEYYIFETTDINIGYCSNRILTIFLENGIIDEEIFDKSSEFLEKFRALERTTLKWNIDLIRQSFEWKQLMILSDRIKKKIENKWTDKELEEIFELDQLVDLEI